MAQKVNRRGNERRRGADVVATSENLYEIVAMLRPDLCLLPRRQVDAALSLLVDAKAAKLARRTH